MKTLILTISLITLTIGTWAQKIYTVAGNGAGYFIGDSIQATSTGVTPNGAVAIDGSGNIFIADTYINRIRKVDASTGMISTVAGTGVGGFNGDGIAATTAQIHYAMAIALDNNGNIYFGDYSNYRIRKIDAISGYISTIAGTGTYGYSGDSLLATSSMIKEATGIAVDNSGNVYFSDLGNSRIRKIDIPTGMLYDLAGTGISGYNGDNIQADHAEINNPYGIALDVSGNIYFADKINNRVRKIDVITGIITTVAGTGVNNTYNGDGIPAINAIISRPTSVDVNLSGDIFIADNNNNGLIYKVNHLDGYIYTVAGTLSGGTTDEGISALSTSLTSPSGVTVDDCGNIYISVSGTNRVRKVFSYDLNLNKTNASCFGQCNGIISINATGGVAPYTYAWSNGMGNGTSFSNLCAGIYTVTVTDQVGCKERLPITITEPEEMGVSISTNSATCHADGSATVSVNGNYPMQYLWSNGSITSSAVGLSAGTFTITITDAVNCSVVDTFLIANSSNSFSSVPICMVTVDSLSQNNIIVWDKTGSANADSFIVYREISTNNYQPIAQIPYSGLSQFVDTVRTLYFPNTGNPNAGTYRYKIQTLDSCGGYSNLSPYHNTIYMLSNGSGIFYWTQPYSIENGTNPVSSYELMRDDISNGNWHVVTSVAGTQQTVSDPLYVIYQNTASWRVRTVWSVACTPTLKNSNSNYSTSFSNICTNNTSGINSSLLENQIFVYPNPTNNKLYIKSNLHSIESFEIINIFGETVISGKKSDLDKTDIIDLSNISMGVYFINIKTSEGIAVKKIIKD